MFRLLGFPVHIRAGFITFMVLIVLLYGSEFGLWLAGALFVFTLIPAGNGVLQRAFGFPWYLLWAVGLLGILSGLRAPGAARPVDMPGEGAVAVRTTRAVATWSVVLVLIGVLALRAAVIFSAQ